VVLDLTRQSVKSQSIFLDGSKVSFLDVGTGGNVLMVPGWSLSPRIYCDSVLELARQGYRVVVPEIYGGSSKINLDNGLSSLSNFVARFGEFVFGGETFSLIGHSLGGGISTSLAANHPLLVSRLVLISSVGHPDWIDRKGLSSTLGNRSINDWAGAFLVDLRRTKERSYLPQVIVEAVGEFAKNPARVVKCALIAKAVDLRAEMAQIKSRQLPVLCIWTKDDVVIPRESFLGLVDAIGASSVELDGTHSWAFEAPMQFSGLISGFLAD
ncbi:unnamed protein product, partial [Acidithrix sp. C25]